MSMKFQEFTIRGFRSLKNVCWKPGDLNIVIGPNGAGKSNLLRFLMLVSASTRGELESFVTSGGGMDPLLWDGQSPAIDFTIKTSPVLDERGPEHYELRLTRLGTGSSYKIDNEMLANYYKKKLGNALNPLKFLERSSTKSVVYDEDERGFKVADEFIKEEESLLCMATGPFTHNHYIPPFQRELSAITVYHDIDTSQHSLMRQSVVSKRQERVDSNGHNLISVLHTLYTSHRDFKRDIDEAMSAAFGNDYEELVFPPAADQRVQLRVRWNSLKREQSAGDLSDGTLRFLFLVAVLASPSRPSLIAIDEPEIGLHPSMFPIVAEYAIEASHYSQVLFTTHSPQFLDVFSKKGPTITIAQCINGETVLATLPDEELERWLKEYSLGTLYSDEDLVALT